MTTLKLETVTLFDIEECGTCGIQFGMPQSFVKARRQDHKIWYCPNGHQRVYAALTEAERLKKELDKAQRATAEWRAEAARVDAEREREKRSHAATKGQLTKVRTRIGNGVCPDCNRHFVNVERHMKTKHGGVS